MKRKRLCFFGLDSFGLKNQTDQARITFRQYFFKAQLSLTMWGHWIKLVYIKNK